MPRVGTNYLQRLMAMNFQTEVLGAEEGGWKHGPCIPKSDGTYLFLTKDPYAWIISFFHWEHIHKRTQARDLASFIHSPVTHPKLAATWGGGSPLDIWNAAHRSWLALGSLGLKSFHRYEDLILDVQGTLGRIGQSYGLDRKHETFIDLKHRADDWITPSPRRKLDITYYSERRYMADHSEESIALLKKQIDPALMQILGYQSSD